MAKRLLQPGGYSQIESAFDYPEVLYSIPTWPAVPRRKPMSQKRDMGHPIMRMVEMRATRQQETADPLWG